MSENNWLNKELRKIELTRKGMIDQYNTMDNPLDPNDIKNILHADLKFTPTENQSWSSYLKELKIYVKFCSEKNIKTHINGPKGAWYTHRNPMGCFACEDINLMHVMFTTMELMVKQYPDTTF